MIGEMVKHYAVLEKIDEGGMGVVYKARDTRLNRVVALKFLAPHLRFDESAKRRFLREAQAASALEDPSFCTIYDIDETDDQHMFISMEFCDGETLKKRISREPIAIAEALELIADAADGLQKAHEKEIVHRDIKPGNLMITTSGGLKILDFGIARLVGSTTLTDAGVVPGTTPYMSPEQTTGLELDGRSDLFSLGVTLYESITGRLPFGGDHPVACQYSIVNLSPKPLTDYIKDTPSGLQVIVDRALEKDRDRRYQTAADMRDAMVGVLEGLDPQAAIRLKRRQRHSGRGAWKRQVRAIAAGATIVAAAAFAAGVLRDCGGSPVSAGPTRLAIMPFENLGPPDDQYFADGLTEELRAKLGGLSGLAVIDQAAAEALSGGSVSDIGEALGVDFIVAGAVRWQKASPGAGAAHLDEVRVTPRLVRVADGQQMWIENYSGSVESIFDVQSDVAMNVVSALAVKLLATEREFLQEQPTDNIEAFDLYLQAGHPAHHVHKDEEELYENIYLYKRAVELDPTFAAAYARLARTYTGLYWHHERRDTLLVLARQALDNALTLDADAPQVRMAEGDYLMHMGENEAALKVFQSVRESQPHNGEVLTQIGTVQTRQGRWEQAIVSLEKALELNPRSIRNLSLLANRCIKTGKYDKGDLYYDRVIELIGEGDVGHYYGIKAWIHVLRDANIEAALAVVGEVPERWQANPFLMHTKAWLEAFRDNYEEAARLFAEPLPYQWGIPTHVPAQSYFNRGFMYSLLGRPRDAFAMYDSARTMLEAEVAVEPSELAYGALGLTYAGLGRKADALRASLRAVTLAEGSAWYEPVLRTWLARTYVLVGEHDAAVEELAWVLAVPSDITVSVLAVDPRWDPLRARDDFKQLLRN